MPRDGCARVTDARARDGRTRVGRTRVGRTDARVLSRATRDAGARASSRDGWAFERLNFVRRSGDWREARGPRTWVRFGTRSRACGGGCDGARECARVGRARADRWSRGDGRTRRAANVEGVARAGRGVARGGIDESEGENVDDGREECDEDKGSAGWS